jgi:hypothetical protein
MSDEEFVKIIPQQLRKKRPDLFGRAVTGGGNAKRKAVR